VSAEPAAADLLRAFVERIERVEEEIRALNADKSDIYKEAKGSGFDVAALRRIVSERRDPAKAAEINNIIELYREALASRVHAHARDAA
jgi:uncharacterized protein (UPF0335 family)